jgi:transcriptional regulator with XRE-family HTH domain
MTLRPGRCLLAYYRKRAKMSQKVFAKRMHVTQPYVSRIEKNEKPMSYTFALNAAHILDCRMEDLYVIDYFHGEPED